MVTTLGLTKDFEHKKRRNEIRAKTRRRKPEEIALYKDIGFPQHIRDLVFVFAVVRVVY